MKLALLVWNGFLSGTSYDKVFDEWLVHRACTVKTLKALKISSLILLALIAVSALFYILCPRPELKTFIPYSKAYVDKEGKLLRLALAADDRYRLFEPLETISPDFIQATILYEDQHFYRHPGVDFFALLRAFWSTYISQQRRVGASTIVMQVARLRWHIPSHTLKGKLYQIIRAIQLARHYSKQDILQAYFNLAPYGRNIEGIAAASLIYFNKKPSELNLPEALSLAVIPQNPNKRNPTTSQGFKKLLVARNLLFKRWLDYYPDDSSKAKYFDLPLNIRTPEQLPYTAPHFIHYTDKQLSNWDKGIINTSLDSRQQKIITDIIKKYVKSKANVGLNNASALLINYQTQRIEAMVGSADFYNRDIFGQVNGTTAKRSPGSTLKPFVYALGMDEGLIHPLSLMKDSSVKFGGFSPENYDKKFLGPISVRDALIQSRNVPAVNLQSALEKKSFYQFLTEVGVKQLKEESYYGLALALGGGEMTMLELGSLYATLANLGLSHSITALQKSSIHKGKRLLSKEASYLVLDILKDNPPPDELEIPTHKPLKNEVAWKTGTSWAFRDAWAVGVSGPYVLVVWVGNFNGKGNNAFIGRSAAGPLLFSLFDAVYPDQGWRVSDMVDLSSLNIKQLMVCSTTGDLQEKYCPSLQQSWFIPGVSPIKTSTIYRRIPINKTTGLRACWHKEGITEQKVFEFWPSDFLRIFNQAGIALKTPPPYEAACHLDDKSTLGQKPVITSPQRVLEYVVRMDSPTDRIIPLQATVDADVKKLHWFINKQYIGSTAKNTPLLWKASPGSFHIRVVDDSGRSSSQQFSVSQAN